MPGYGPINSMLGVSIVVTSCNSVLTVYLCRRCLADTVAREWDVLFKMILDIARVMSLARVLARPHQLRTVCGGDGLSCWEPELWLRFPTARQLAWVNVWLNGKLGLC